MMKEVFMYVMRLDKSIILMVLLDPNNTVLPPEGKVIKSNITQYDFARPIYTKSVYAGYTDIVNLCWIWFSEKKNEEATKLLLKAYDADKRMKKIHRKYIRYKNHITKQTLCFKTKLGKYLKPADTDYLYQYIKRFDPENRNTKRIKNILGRSFDIYTLQDLVNKPVSLISFGKTRGVGKKILEMYAKISHELYRIKKLQKSCVNIKTSK